MEKTEAKLRTSLRSKKGVKKSDKESEVVIVRRKNSDDEPDEFFDRTKQNAFQSSTK